MNNHPQTQPEYRLEFAVFALEATAQKANIPTDKLFDRLNKLGLVQSLLLDCYDTLHTQSRGYVTSILLEALQNWEEATHEKEESA